jgi:hypothetical protein
MGNIRLEGNIQLGQKPVNLEYSVVLKGMFKFKPARQFVELYHSMSCAVNMEDLISNNFCNFSK